MYHTNFVPRNVVSFNDFVRYAPPNSVAFDGFVGAENGSVPGYVNYNHHENSGPKTRSACWQIYHAILDGSLDEVVDTGGNWYGFLNHVDGDSVFANYLLAHKDEIKNGENSLMKKLVSIEDRLDVTAGLTYVEPEELRKVAWVFRPCNGYRNMHVDEKTALNVLGEVDRRISAYTSGASEEVELNMGYIVLFDMGDWKIVEEIGPDSRNALARDGITSFLSIKARDDGNLSGSLINMNAAGLYPILNTAEGIADSDPDHWSGAGNRGGPPREKGTRLSLHELRDIISSYRESTG